MTETNPKIKNNLAYCSKHNCLYAKKAKKCIYCRQEAKEELKRCAGTQFNPDFVDEFVRI